jgi:hypothetical protein
LSGFTVTTLDFIRSLTRIFHSAGETEPCLLEHDNYPGCFLISWFILTCDKPVALRWIKVSGRSGRVPLIGS